MKMRLGVIGGMGSEATSYYFEELVKHTAAEKDQDHIDTIIFNHASIVDRTKAILTGEVDTLIEQLTKDVRMLEQLEVDNIAIPCNTSHYFYDILQEEANVPIIHMVKETIKHAVNQFEGVRKIGVLATTGTIQSGVYKKEIEELGLETVIPSPSRQEDVMSLIYDDIKKGKPGEYEKFERAYDELVDKGSDVVILACTELSVFKKSNKLNDNCLDAMDVLVKESIVRSNASYQ